MLDTRRSSQVDSYYYRHRANAQPDWRLQRANEYSKTPHLCPSDHFTQILVYVTTGDKRRSDFYGAELAALFENAFEIRNTRLDRLAIESRILAYRDLKPVSRHCGLPYELVEVYATAFFDVLPRIQARVWIQNCVIDYEFFRLDVLRRQLYQLSYHAGPIVAEHWLGHLPFIGQRIEHDLGTTDGIERETLEMSLLERDVRHPLSSKQQEAFDAECCHPPADPRSVASILNDSCRDAMNTSLDESDLSQALAEEVKYWRQVQFTDSLRSKNRRPKHTNHTVKMRKSA